MNRIKLFLLFAVIITLSSCKNKNYNFSGNYEGLINDKYPITVNLDVYKGNVTGTYYYNKYNIPVNISGYIFEDSIIFDGADSKGKLIDHFRGLIRENQINGKWIKGNGKRIGYFSIHSQVYYSRGSGNISIAIIIGIIVILALMVFLKRKRGNKETTNNTIEEETDNVEIKKSTTKIAIEIEETQTFSINDLNKKKGDDFEKYVTTLFSKNYFILKDWRSDKGFNGNFAESNMQPDLVLECKWIPGVKPKFAIECKYRSRANNGYVNLTKNEAQLENYKNFGRENNCPVFLMLGLGGDPKNPDELYVLPIENIQYSTISLDKLRSFENKTRSVFYDVNLRILR